MLVNKQTQKQKSPHTKLFFPAFETLGEGHLKCPKIPQDNPLRLAESRLSFLRCQDGIHLRNLRASKMELNGSSLV